MNIIHYIMKFISLFQPKFYFIIRSLHEYDSTYMTLKQNHLLVPF
ncbi:hypothetical protein J500_0204 [Acinetobacter sp. 479375]|nr:hypothetical protein J500_0204 [Acinetobacter sp. 479375]BBF78415.1 hypothetical protein URS_2434 [Acinetobacter ursingii]